MGCAESNLFRPGHLPEEEYWAIISSDVALSGMANEKLQELQDIGRKIAKKCKGLPLAAKALGGLLRFRESKEEWKSVLDSEMWELGEEEAVIGRDLIALLWLSYQDLSPVERQCLTYCASYPKDHKFSNDNLIISWMAQGYLKETNTKDMRTVGDEYIKNMSVRSFFQNFEKYRDGRIKSFKMHDIVHDFVVFSSKKECLHIEYSNDSDNEEMSSFREAARYLQIVYRNQVMLANFPSIILRFRRLRSLAVKNLRGLDLRVLFDELTSLRSLALVNCDITKIPSTIGKLVHLRLLDLHHNSQLERLPEQVGDLCNLLSLDLRRCHSLDKTQRLIEKLSSLRYLETSGPAIRLTSGIGRLSGLRAASFSVDFPADQNDEASSLENLKNMKHLNSLSLALWRNMKHANGAKQAQLSKKKHLVKLTVSVFSPQEITGSADEWKQHDEELLEAIEPCTYLKELIISGYIGTKQCPRWLLSLNCLTMLELESWENCGILPPLGKLPSLTILSLWEMKVKRVGLEFLGLDRRDIQASSSTVAFPKLKMLEFWLFTEWEEWEMEHCGGFTVMLHLSYLKVSDTPALKALPDHLLQKTTLRILSIVDSYFLVERYKRNEGVDWHKLSHIPHIEIR